MKYLDEDTNLSIKYENTYWIELPSITICILYDRGNYDQTNMTFKEYMTKINEPQFNIISNANLSYTNPTFAKYVLLTSLIVRYIIVSVDKSRKSRTR